MVVKHTSRVLLRLLDDCLRKWQFLQPALKCCCHTPNSGAELCNENIVLNINTWFKKKKLEMNESSAWIVV